MRGRPEIKARRFAVRGRLGRRLSTKAVDKTVDGLPARHREMLQQCSTVKLLKISPPYFSLIHQLVTNVL